VKRHFLSKRDSKEFFEILNRFGIDADSRTVELEENDVNIIYIDKNPVLLKFEDTWLPTLKVMIAKNFPSVTIDDGALERIKNGAKLYSVGIKQIEGEIRTKFPVVIKDLRGKSIGSAIVESDENDIREKRKGSYLLIYELHV
jgi:PUA domain protein